MKSVTTTLTIALTALSLGLFANTASAMANNHQEKVQQQSKSYNLGYDRWQHVQNKFNVGNQHK